MNISKNELIQEFNNFYKKHNRRPRNHEMSKEIHEACNKYFGSWSKALKETRLMNKEYTKDQVKNKVLELYNKTKEAPKLYDLPNDMIFFIRKYYDTYTNLLYVELGMPSLNLRQKDFSIDYAKNKILNYYKENKQIPTFEDMKGDANFPSSKGIFKDKFGFTWSRFLLNIGLKLNISFVDDSDEELLEQYKNLSKKIGYPANSVDINNSKDMYLYGVYAYRFGNLENLKKEAGFENGIPRIKYTRNEIKKMLVDEYIKNDDKPLTAKAIENNKNLPSVGTIKRHFLNTRMEEIWEEIEKEAKK